jgi:general secretion pathway protein B
MSYILEALRRAERERDMGKAPTVDALHRPPPPSTTRRMPPAIWMLAGATAVIAVAAVVALLWPHHAQEPTSLAAATATPPQTQPAPAPATTMAPRDPINAPASGRPAAIEGQDDIASLDDLTGGGDAGPAPELQPQDLGLEAAEPQVPAGSNLVTPRAPASAAPAETAGNPAPAATPPPAPDQTAAQPAGHPTVVVPPGVTVLREMPAAYRSQFPVTTLEVHVYDPDPARRWIMVGGQRYREGQSLASGPTVVEISDNGVVFDFQGARVLMPVK